jgi:RNA polymerase sigma factor (sigma-70 family)
MGHLGGLADGGWGGVERAAVSIVSPDQRRILDHRRSVERRARLGLRLAREPAPPTPIEPSDQALWHSFRTLPRRQRAAVAPHYVADLTRREVADAMGLSEGTVDQHLHRAPQKMRGAGTVGIG